MHSYQFYTSSWGLLVNSFEHCGPFIYSTLNKQHLETWSCVSGYYAYGLFLCFRWLWNIPKNTRALGMCCGQFPSGINGLIWTDVLFNRKSEAYTPYGFRYSFAGGFWEALTNNREGTGIELNNSRYDSQTCTCVLKNCLHVFWSCTRAQNWRCFCFVCGMSSLSP